jgi:hypothetical protein
MQVSFMLLPKHTLGEMSGNPWFLFEDESALIGHLWVDHASESMIGIGAFKTVHPGRFSLMSASSEEHCRIATAFQGSIGTPSTGGLPVVVKRMYKGSITRIGRYNGPEELVKTLIEANIMYWSYALYDIFTSFLERFKQDHPERVSTFTVVMLLFWC